MKSNNASGEGSMNRVTENAETIKMIVDSPGSADINTIAVLLGDISKSLAVIADGIDDVSELDKMVVNDSIYNGIPLNDVKNSMVDEINKLETVNMPAGVRVFKDDVIDAINDWYPKNEGITRTDYMTVNEIRQAMGLKVENDPTIESRTEGIWQHEIRRKNNWSFTPSTCSECGHKYTEYVCGYEWEETGDLPKFCPNCGAKMREEEETEEELKKRLEEWKEKT